MTALSVLSRYAFDYLRPGENDDDCAFTGPGLVIICREEPANHLGESVFAVLTARSADQDALVVAKSLLAQRAQSEGYVYAMLASIESRNERIQALKELEPRCIEGM